MNENKNDGARCEAYEDYIKKIVDRFNVAVEFLWVEQLTGQKLLEIETRIAKTPKVPDGFWDNWPMNPTSFPLYMRAGDSALHIAAMWSETIQGTIAYGRLRALQRPRQFCTDLSEQEAKSWIEAAIESASNHTDMTYKPIDRFREVDLLRRKIYAEITQWSNTPKERISALDALADQNLTEAWIKRFKEETEVFSDNQWSDKVDRRTKARAKEGRGRNTRSFFIEGVGGIYYGDDRTYVIRDNGKLGYYSLAATHSERIGKKFAIEFSLNRR